MLKAVYFEILEYAPENLALLRSSFDLVELGDPAQLTDRLLGEVEVLFAPLGYQFDATFLAKCPRLQVVATNTTGVPHIDVEYAVARGIKVVSLKDERAFLDSITPTAELTIGLMVCITRNVAPAVTAVVGGRWRRWDFGGPAMLSRMSLGIVGLGRLGQMVARYARAMGMKIVYHDPFLAASPSGLDYTRSDTLEELVSSCDITSIHIPMTAANRHLFSAGIFAKFKHGAFLINTARGEIVDSIALVDALQSGRLAGAALDVLDGEFEPGFQERVGDHPLVRYASGHNNLIITPHIAGSTKDAWYLTQRFTIERALAAVSTSAGGNSGAVIT
jgi:phosphoglycerate dehydrogenase-like enzyme